MRTDNERRCACRRHRASRYIDLGGFTHDLCMPIARFIADAAHHRDLLQRVQNDPRVGELDERLQEAIALAIRKNGADHV